MSVSRYVVSTLLILSSTRSGVAQDEDLSLVRRLRTAVASHLVATDDHQEAPDDGMPSSAIPTIVRLLRAGSWPEDAKGPSGTHAERRISAKERRVLRAMVGTMSPSALSAYVTANLGTFDDGTRRVLLDLLAAVGDSYHVSLAARLVSTQEGGTTVALLKPLEFAVEEILRRDPGALRRVREAFRSANGPVRAALIRAIANASSSGTLETLEGLVVLHREEDVLPLLSSMMQVVERGADPTCLAKSRSTLAQWLEERDVPAQLLAARLLARIEDTEVIGPLIRLMASDPDGALGKGLHEVLRELTGLALPRDGRAWTAWHDAQRTWSESNFERIAEGLRAEEPEVFFEALREVLAHPVVARPFAPLLEDALHRDDARFLLVCDALGELRWRPALPLLERLAEERSGSHAAAARQAVHAITGQADDAAVHDTTSGRAFHR